MFSLKQAIILALVGSTFAAPVAHWGHHRQDKEGPVGGRTPGTQGNEGTKYVVVVSGNTGSTQPTTTTPDVPATTAPVVVATSGSSSGNTGADYMVTVNEWRVKMNRPAFKQDSEMEANARKTASDGNGDMIHQLIGNSRGQVLAPGKADNFESVFVGGWLCEVPTLPGLSSVCPTMSKGWNHAGQTGHADILSSTKYTKIGCALSKGIWACDVS